MKNKIFILLALAAVLVSTGCSKQFLEDMQPYDKYGEEQVFSNETLTQWYIDRLYNYYFVNYRNPLQDVIGLYNQDRTNMTEETGGTVPKFINDKMDLKFATDADTYYGNTTAGVNNNPYTRIRYCNDLLEKMDDPISSALSASFKKLAKGQAYILRAMQYFDLVRVYGGVPIVTSVSDNSTTDESIQTPRSTSSECFAQIVSDLDSAAMLLPMTWDDPASQMGRLNAAAAIALKSRVLLTAASPLFNKDWDNPGNAKWQAALKASLEAETKLSGAGYGLYGSNAKEWSEMCFAGKNSYDFNKEAIIVFLFSNTSTSSEGYNNSWENQVRPKDYDGGGGLSATKQMLDLFPLADGSRPTAENYVDTFFFENRDPRFYRTFAFSGEKWGIAGNENKTTWFYRWKSDPSKSVYYGNNQTNSPAIVRKNSNPEADSTSFEYSKTSIINYRYSELLLNIAECYAATGDINNAIAYIGKIRQRVGIPAANNYGIGNLSSKYQAIEAVLYERRVELAYEGKRFWDVQRWMLYANVPQSGNTVQKLGLQPINGTRREGYYWQAKEISATDPLTAEEKNILIDPDASDFKEQLDKLKAVYQKHFVITPLDKSWDQVNGVDNYIQFKPNYYLSGLPSTVLAKNGWLEQNLGWQDYSGGAGIFDYQK